MNIDAADISDSCLTLDEGFLIFIIPGVYATPPVIYMFDTELSIIEKASYDDKGRGFTNTPLEFGPRVGTKINLEGFGGDAGCESTQYFEYDFIKNQLTLKKEYGICESDSIEGGSGEWTYY